MFPHSPYSPKLVPNDYYFFPNLKIWLQGKRFHTKMRRSYRKWGPILQSLTIVLFRRYQNVRIQLEGVHFASRKLYWRITIILCATGAQTRFSLQLTVAQCSVLRYRGMKCKNWTAHAHIAMQRSAIFLFFFFVQHYSTLLAKPCTFELLMRLLKSITTTQDR